uniref:Uncharacterized protein n=1 Tax=Panagrolaimus davidi TaxID=227884 RepID=A0A914PM76_9BILA
MDFGAALSSLIKPQPQFSLTDPTTLLALANLKYPMNNFNLPNYAHSLIQPRNSMANGIPNFDLASIIAAATATATAQHDTSTKLNFSSLTTNVSLPSLEPSNNVVVTTPTRPSTTSSNNGLSQLPIPIPAQPTSPTQSSASASSISSGGSSSSIIQSAQSSPTRQNGSTTPLLFGGGYKRKLSGTPTRKPPKPIPDENKAWRRGWKSRLVPVPASPVPGRDGTGLNFTGTGRDRDYKLGPGIL